MTKWHNGPNGPGICRAEKGNCPFGGADSHYSSQEEAQETFDVKNSEEFGMLPGMKSKADTKHAEKTLIAYNSKGILLASTNFISSDENTYNENMKMANTYFNDTELDGETMAAKLSNDRNVNGEWKVKDETDDRITLESFDAFGNKRFLDVKIKKEKKKDNRGTIMAQTGNGINSSLSNYVDNQNGYEESKEYFTKLIKSSNDDSKVLVDKLNNDNRVFGDWSLDSEDDEKIVVKQVDYSGNEDFVTVFKS